MAKKNKNPSIFENRIIGSGEMPVEEILFNPKNWRIHPKYQQDAVLAVLEKIGWVQQIIVNRTTGNLVDGHLRVNLASRNDEPTVPVVFVELSEEEESEILASLDPLAGMGVADSAKLGELMDEFETSSVAIENLLSDLAHRKPSPKWVKDEERPASVVGGNSIPMPDLGSPDAPGAPLSVPGFSPEVSPEFSSKEVTEAAVDKKREELEERFDGAGAGDDLTEIVCPHCGGEFSIHKDQI